MKRTTLLLMIVAGFSAAAPLKPKGSGDTPSELEGKWVVKVAITNGGIEQPHLTDAVIVIVGDQFTYTNSAKSSSRGRLKVDTKGRPKRLEFEAQAEDGKLVANDKKGGWIYELDGDELQMASFTNSTGTAPEKFDPTDPKQMIWKAKRVKD